MAIHSISKKWGWLKSLLFDQRCKSTHTTERLKTLSHSCALTALSRVMPDRSYDEISNAFYNCCDKWPNGGVTNKEFNIVLNYLGIAERFKYDDSDNFTIGTFYEHNAKCTVLLIHGHFTVVHKQKIFDSHGCDSLRYNTKVYASWALIS